MNPPVLLSASVPDRDFQIYGKEPVAIREAVRAVVAHVTVRGPLVFGGHPAITPLVWQAARSLDVDENVYIYQSEMYRRLIPKEAAYFRRLVWTKAVPKPRHNPNDPWDKRASLVEMREQMIISRHIDGGVLPKFAAAVFIGGMDGVEDEWKLFVSKYPGTPAYPIASTEGAARRLFEEQRFAPSLVGDALNLFGQHVSLLESEGNYREVARKLLP